MVGEAGFRVASIYEVQANEGVYDQSMAERAINAFKDFQTLNAGNANLKPKLDEASDRINRLHLERVRGAIAIAEFYERRGKWIAAYKYFGETSSRAATVEGLASKDSLIYEEAQALNQQAKTALSRVAKKSVLEALSLAEKLADIEAAELENLDARNLGSIERAARSIELNLRLPESELRAALGEGAADFETVLAIKKNAETLLPAAEAELDRREAEANKE